MLPVPPVLSLLLFALDGPRSGHPTKKQNVAHQLRARLARVHAVARTVTTRIALARVLAAVAWTVPFRARLLHVLVQYAAAWRSYKHLRI